MTHTPSSRPASFKELLGRVTPGPWHANTASNGALDIFSQHPDRRSHQICSRSQWYRVEESHANAQYIARLNPETMKLVVEALEMCSVGDVRAPDRAIKALEALNTPTQ